MLTDLPDVSLGWQIAHWIETLLCHGPGDVEGQPINLDEDWLAALVRMYQVDESGRRQVRRYILSRSKGRAKSELGGFIACAAALGPVRFDHWAVRGETSWWGYEYEPGEPVGARQTRPFIRCLATEELQAGNTYDNVYFILGEQADGHARIREEITGIDAGLTRTFLPGGGEIRPSSAASASKDGGKETDVIFDETHLYVLPELKAMHRMVRRNLAKRGGWSLETTTMFELGAESTAEITFKAAEEGKLPADVVIDHHEGPDPDTFDWDDDTALGQALREAYRTNLHGNPDTWVDVQARIAEIRDPDTEKADAVRFFLNRSHSMASDVVDLTAWGRLTVDGELADGDQIVAAFDGSDANDSTGLVAVRIVDGFTKPLGVWEKPDGAAGKGWKVPRAAVHAAVRDMFARFDVVLLYCDRRLWETDIDEWAAEFGDQVVLDIPQSDKRLSEAASRFTTLVAAALAAQGREEVEATFSEMICHDGDVDLARHLGNARRKRLTGRIGKDGGWIPAKKKPDRKIDLAAATILAHQARGDAIARGIVSEPLTGSLLV